jgi:HTH-type transcriptional regulator / antitoxin HipB
MHIRRPEDISALIKDSRRKGGMTQLDFANRLGVSRKWVSEFELGNSAAEIGLVLRALNELGVKIIVTEAHTFERPLPVPVGAFDIDTIADMNIGSTNKPQPKGRRK